MMNMVGSGKGAGGKAKGARAAGGPPQTATVRYEDAGTAQRALQHLNGSSMNGTQIGVAQDPRSKDGRRLIVRNIPSEAEWQEIKDHFNSIGKVEFADIIDSGDGSTVCGTVRYFGTQEALAAIATLNGTNMNGNIIDVKMHGGTKDQTKIQISGMPPGTEWQEVKDYFGQIGQIAFAETFSSEIKRKGEIRYDDPGHAQQALQMLNGSILGGSPIFIEFDQRSRDATRLIIHEIPAGIEWQELKDHFKQIGTVAFSDIKGSGKGKGGSGKDGGKGAGMDQTMVQIPVHMFNELMQGSMNNKGKPYGQAKGFNSGGCGAITQRLGGKGGSGFGSPYGGGDTATMQLMATMNQVNDPPSSGRVLVRGYDFGTTEEQLRAHMGQAGPILRVDWITDGSAEIVYQMWAAAEAATVLDKSIIFGNRRFIDVVLK
jgi:RNA recognition motif-containing protein